MDSEPLTRVALRSLAEGEPEMKLRTGIAIGMALGPVIGVVIDNIGAGIAIGMNIGVTWGLVFGADRNDHDDRGD